MIQDSLKCWRGSTKGKRTPHFCTISRSFCQNSQKSNQSVQTAGDIWGDAEIRASFLRPVDKQLPENREQITSSGYFWLVLYLNKTCKSKIITICLSAVYPISLQLTFPESAGSLRHCSVSSHQPHEELHTPLLAWYQAFQPRKKEYINTFFSLKAKILALILTYTKMLLWSTLKLLSPDKIVT